MSDYPKYETSSDKIPEPAERRPGEFGPIPKAEESADVPALEAVGDSNEAKESKESKEAQFAQALAEDEKRRTMFGVEIRQSVLDAVRKGYRAAKFTTALAVSGALAMVAHDTNAREKAERLAGEAALAYAPVLGALGAKDLSYALDRTGMDLVHGEQLGKEFVTITDNPALSPETAKFLDERHGKITVTYMSHRSGRGKVGFEEYEGNQDLLVERHRLQTTERAAPREVYLEYDAPSVAKSGTMVHQKDKFGNDYTAWYREDGGKVRAEVLVNLDTEDAIYGPGSAYDSMDAEAQYTVSVDLSDIGGPRMERLIEGWAMRQAGDLSGDSFVYPLFVDAANHNDRDKIATDFMISDLGESLGKEISRAESLFGIKEGSAVRRVVVTGKTDGNINATSGHSTLILPVEMLDFQQGPWMDDAVDIARHETLHAVDKFSALSDGLAAIHAGTSPRLFAAVNEGSLLHLRAGDAGHSEDNPRELFASLMNGLLADEDRWEDGVRNMKTDVRGEYAVLLSQVRDELLRSPRLAKAEIMPLIADRLLRVEKIQANTEAPMANK